MGRGMMLNGIAKAVDHDLRRRLIRVTHAEINNIQFFRVGFPFQLRNSRKKIRRKPVETIGKFRHDGLYYQKPESEETENSARRRLPACSHTGWVAKLTEQPAVVW